jgi:hypothetical protein
MLDVSYHDLIQIMRHDLGASLPSSSTDTARPTLSTRPASIGRRVQPTCCSHADIVRDVP